MPPAPALAGAARRKRKKGSNMTARHLVELEELDEETGGQSRGSSHAMWTQRRQAKRRAKVRAKRHRASMAASNGIHLRRNKRFGW
jgi:hypothetical protein